jgi:hypothetical protein
MLEISYRNGSYTDPLVGPKMVTRACQTDPAPASSSATSFTLSPATTDVDVAAAAVNSGCEKSGKSSGGISSAVRTSDESNGQRSLVNISLFFIAILLLHYHHKGDMRQPDMAFCFMPEV